MGKANWAACVLATALAGALFVAIPGDAAFAISPSFDCAKASTDDEIAICSSNELSEMDNVVAAGFAYVRASRGNSEARAIALPLLRLRQACGSDTACILQRQIDSVRTFQQLGAPVRLPEWATATQSETAVANGMPMIIGECTTSTISEIGGRLGDADFESGTAVGFANGGWQVTYDKEFGIIRSQVGDPVSICLVELPQDCPPGDDRGKIYTTINQRTGDSWTLPDSQHSCGGA